MFEQYAPNITPLKGNITTEHLEKNNAEFIDVHAMINRLGRMALYHLRCHICRSAQKHICLGECNWIKTMVVLQDTSNAKICQYELSGFAEQEVAWFQITVDDMP